MAEFLLEIGTEEMPADWLPVLGEQLGRVFDAASSRERLVPREIDVAWTPRRLVLAARVLERQPDREERMFGPLLRMARGPAGQWTPAGLGFARKMGCPPEALEEAAKDGASEPYVSYMRKTDGQDASLILPALIAATLRGLAFPKRMNWDAWLDDGKGAFPFGRPIRWLLALLDGAVIPFRIHAVENGVRGRVINESGNVTRGHRFLPRRSAGRPVTVRSLTDLKRKLRARFVLLDPAEREARIRDALASHLARIHDDHGLIRTWRDLVEFPAVVFGAIPAEFQRLPGEVLEAVLVHHQKYIPIMNEGRAIARFAAVVNGDAGSEEIVRGMERVVVARLRDAAFFFEEDLKRPLEDRVKDLAGVVFHEGLGTYREKVERIIRLIDVMGPKMGLLTRQDHEGAREAARVCKADLTTLMVREFPELQGMMGGVYLRAQGTPRLDVAQAVQWHYHPLSIDADAPPFGRMHGGEIALFAALSVADKLDTLAGCFGLGLIPTGSSDPFGLRRAAQGVIRVLLDFWDVDAGEKRPSMRRLVMAAIEGHEVPTGRSREEIAADLERFLIERLRFMLVARGFPPDEVDAALGAREPDALDDPRECHLRLEALHRARSEAAEDFAHLAVAFKRAKNILGDGVHAAPDTSLYARDAERDLDAEVTRLSKVGSGYEERLKALSGLRGPVDRFFEEVLVMDEDPRIRENRLGLLARTLALFLRVADVASLTTAARKTEEEAR
ncbi:MAG: glycine--tRNA ligase subunit beta [Vicinamibacteria bacterium]|nr:glycine--tRNA ligase subunit beta [Vicinamibacteria bacterium]